MSDPRELVYRTAALLAELDRALNPIPRREPASFRVEPNVPPPLPPIVSGSGPAGSRHGVSGSSAQPARAPALSPPPPPRVAPPTPPPDRIEALPARLSDAPIAEALPAAKTSTTTLIAADAPHPARASAELLDAPRRPPPSLDPARIRETASTPTPTPPPRLRPPKPPQLPPTPSLPLGERAPEPQAAVAPPSPGPIAAPEPRAITSLPLSRAPLGRLPAPRRRRIEHALVTQLPAPSQAASAVDQALAPPRADAAASHTTDAPAAPPVPVLPARLPPPGADRPHRTHQPSPEERRRYARAASLAALSLADRLPPGALPPPLPPPIVPPRAHPSSARAALEPAGMRRAPPWLDPPEQEPDGLAEGHEEAAAPFDPELPGPPPRARVRRALRIGLRVIAIDPEAVESARNALQRRFEDRARWRIR